MTIADRLRGAWWGFLHGVPERPAGAPVDESFFLPRSDVDVTNVPMPAAEKPAQPETPRQRPQILRG